MNYNGFGRQFNVPVSLPTDQLGAGGQLAARQLSMGAAGHLPKGSWSDGLFSCTNSFLILIFVCCCPCVRFGISINRVFPDVGFLRPCTIFLILYIAFGGLWWVGYALLPSGWLWLPAVIIAFPVVGYAAWYRSKIRARYDIPGTIVVDYVADLFCLLCALCQEARHIDRDHGIPV